MLKTYVTRTAIALSLVASAAYAAPAFGSETTVNDESATRIAQASAEFETDAIESQSQETAEVAVDQSEPTFEEQSEDPAAETAPEEEAITPAEEETETLAFARKVTMAAIDETPVARASSKDRGSYTLDLSDGPVVLNAFGEGFAILVTLQEGTTMGGEGAQAQFDTNGDGAYDIVISYGSDGTTISIAKDAGHTGAAKETITLSSSQKASIEAEAAYPGYYSTLEVIYEKEQQQSSSSSSAQQSQSDHKSASTSSEPAQTTSASSGPANASNEPNAEAVAESTTTQDTASASEPSQEQSSDATKKNDAATSTKKNATQLAQTGDMDTYSLIFALACIGLAVARLARKAL